MNFFPRITSTSLKNIWREHSLALLFFAFLAILFTWPTIQHLTTSITGNGSDPLLMVWRIWQVQQAATGQQAWFFAPLFVYPLGVPLLINSTGPTVGLLMLPFWGLGPEAAYNLTLILGTGLTGYCMYVLARGLAFDRSLALFAGVVLLAAEMHLAGLLGHLEKVVLALLPLLLLALLRAIDLTRSRWWTVIAAILLLLVLLHNAWQAVLALMAVVFFWSAHWLSTDRSQRRQFFRRGLLLATCLVIFSGPVIAEMAGESSRLPIEFERRMEAFNNQPDLIEFFLPSRYSRLFGQATINFLDRHQIDWSIETTVSLAYVGILLSVLAAFTRKRPVWYWLVFLLICMLLSLGPTLKIFGRSEFTAYHLPINLPYAWLTSLPGLGFMRAPGRFMMIGFVAFAVVATYGLKVLTDRFPKWKYPLVSIAVLGILIPAWPRDWPAESLPPVPDFYQTLAQDQSVYGVFDLPLKSSSDSSALLYSVRYQIYQMTHHKGISYGYLSYTYVPHPFLDCLYSTEPRPMDVTINHTLSDCTANVRYQLAAHNYRYVVLHKPDPKTGYYAQDTWGEQQSAILIQSMFGSQLPLIDDELTQVYAVGSITDTWPATNTVELGRNWSRREPDWRWAASPAILSITAVRNQHATLQIVLSDIYDPQPQADDIHRGVLIVQTDRSSSPIAITAQQTVTVPIDLVAGSQSITLTLQAGNFTPRNDPRQLSFAVRSIDLLTTSP